MLLNESHRALIALLHAEEASCVVRRGDTVRLFRRRGVKDLYDLLKHDPALLDGAFVADKVVGKGAAALLILGGVREVYADSVSEPALELLRQAGVAVAYGTATPRILRRDGSGGCPVETLCSDCRTADECLPRIEQFLEQMHNREKQQ